MDRAAAHRFAFTFQSDGCDRDGRPEKGFLGSGRSAGPPLGGLPDCTTHCHQSAIELLDAPRDPSANMIVGRDLHDRSQIQRDPGQWSDRGVAHVRRDALALVAGRAKKRRFRVRRRRRRPGDMPRRNPLDLPMHRQLPSIVVRRRVEETKQAVKSYRCDGLQKDGIFVNGIFVNGRPGCKDLSPGPGYRLVIRAHEFHPCGSLSVAGCGVRMGASEKPLLLLDVTMADFANTLPKSHDVLPSARSDPFLLAVAHDLRSRMTAISGFAHTLRRGDIDASMRTLLFDRLGVNVVAMDRLLSGLLDLERARSPNGLRLELIDLAEVARNTVASQPAADNRIRVDTKPVLANADAALVDRIIDNLIVNALKHTSNGSPVWVRVRPRSDGGLIVVDDAGPGVPDGEKQRVFEAFVSGGQTRGSGVGLSLVARFAEMHGGRAWVQDRPGGGASFRVFIPDGTE